MNNIEIRLNELIDIIRKDTGINNTMDAMEQLSAILLLKYFYEVILNDVDKPKDIENFTKLFSKLEYLNKEKTQTDFSKFKNLVRDIYANENTYFFEKETVTKIEFLLDNTPFRIRSTKILEVLLSDLEDMEFNKQLAEAYDNLLVKMTNESSASGAFYSPRELVNTIVKAMKPSSGDLIYDPTLGSGGFLVEAQKLVLEENLDKSQNLIKAFGQDISPFASLIGSLNLLLNGMSINNLVLGDSLLNNDNSQYDIVFSNMPFGKVSNIDKYKYSYKEYASNFETMFVKLIMNKLAKNGKAAILVPEGFLFNSSNEFVDLRERLLKDFNLHTILSLPFGTLAPYSGVKVSVLFFDNSKTEDSIWFYELKTDKPLNKSNKIKEENLKEFLELFAKRADTLHSSLINKKDILDTKGFNLSIQFFQRTDKKSEFQILDEIQFIKEKKEEFNKLVSDFSNLIEENKKANFEKKVTLEELFTIKSGKYLEAKKINKDKGKYLVYGGNGIRGFYEQYNREGENIIVGQVGANCGNIHFIEEPIWLASNAFSIQLKSIYKVYLPYLAHLLRSLNLNKLARGSAQPAISYAKIKDIEISLPSYEQQKELSKWFDEIEIQNKKLLEAIELQTKKFSDLSTHMIVSNCVKDGDL